MNKSKIDTAMIICYFFNNFRYLTTPAVNKTRLVTASKEKMKEVIMFM